MELVNTTNPQMQPWHRGRWSGQKMNHDSWRKVNGHSLRNSRKEKSLRLNKPPRNEQDFGWTLSFVSYGLNTSFFIAGRKFMRKLIRKLVIPQAELRDLEAPVWTLWNGGNVTCTVAAGAADHWPGIESWQRLAGIETWNRSWDASANYVHFRPRSLRRDPNVFQF